MQNEKSKTVIVTSASLCYTDIEQKTNASKKISMKRKANMKPLKLFKSKYINDKNINDIQLIKRMYNHD